MTDPFPGWVEALEARHTASLTFTEVRKALQALSSVYVQQRSRLAAGEALGSAGKRAAFALFYGPLHFLLVREIVRALDAAQPAPQTILDLGCGTGVAGAAWALGAGGRATVEGVDRNGWAVDEARFTFGRLGLRGRARRADLADAALPGRRGAIVAALTVNELPDDAREALLRRLLEAHGAGASVLVVEPIARGVTPWWARWADAVTGAGGRVDEWRFPAGLPPRLALLDRAAGLDHRELTGRSTFLRGGSAGSRV
ncbi:MAG: methyltransferase domain-containing protein [Vicinamibacteria bacterium]